MQLSKRTLPTEHKKKVNTMTPHTQSLPFYVKECGYIGEKKFSVGHQNSYSEFLLLYTVSGILKFDKHHTTTFLHPHDLVVSSCNTPLSFIRTSKECSFFYAIISGSHAKQFYNSIRTMTNVYTSDPTSYLIDHFIDLFNLDYSEEPLPNLEASLLIQHIMLELYVLTQNIANARTVTPVQESVINSTVKYIHANYMNPLSIDTICNEVSFSKYYFCKLFKTHMGVSIHQYLTEYRITKAKELLMYSKLSIGAVANSVGYKNTLAFSRAFERSTHMTPTEFRRYY